MNDDEMRANAQGKPNICPECHGDWWVGTRKVPHAASCSRRNDPIPPLPRPYTPAEQDRDARALRYLGAPVCVREDDPEAGDRDDYILGGR